MEQQQVASSQSGGGASPAPVKKKPLLKTLKKELKKVKWTPCLIWEIIIYLAIVTSGAILFMVMVGMIHPDDPEAWTEISSQVLNGIFTYMAFVNQPYRLYYLRWISQISSWHGRQRKEKGREWEQSLQSCISVCASAPEAVKKALKSLSKDFPFIVVPAFALEDEMQKGDVEEARGERESPARNFHPDPVQQQGKFNLTLPLPGENPERSSTEMKEALTQDSPERLHPPPPPSEPPPAAGSANETHTQRAVSPSEETPAEEDVSPSRHTALRENGTFPGIDPNSLRGPPRVLHLPSEPFKGRGAGEDGQEKGEAAAGLGESPLRRRDSKGGAVSPAFEAERTPMTSRSFPVADVFYEDEVAGEEEEGGGASEGPVAPVVVGRVTGEGEEEREGRGSNVFEEEKEKSQIGESPPTAAAPGGSPSSFVPPHPVLHWEARKPCLAVVILLNLNCLFQYPNAFAMWYWAPDPPSRPFWIVPVFLLLSFGCGFAGGINFLRQTGKHKKKYPPPPEPEDDEHDE
uniref:Transmembrane protein n=1 Tax=Chromera velia CCMP2878 TaxID=1169474 RepID=A0A0G4G905_9ALVE|eukprot:Cvel_4369.t1-p1 / transcript=Cvel_4369.t1 / gene=Cvel_4369 / organism=Chromera_velia_CCMP2878 / gene_product=hypothetical protein / transcript_product=hypothetical protein / location=Cvel_scaffold189:77034-78587(+) / protein_length=518 / sequence_SO=supercontig / SO=protein_coding / is_pseudo=false